MLRFQRVFAKIQACFVFLFAMHSCKRIEFSVHNLIWIKNRFPLPINCMQANSIHCCLFLPYYFSPHKPQELLGHTVSQITSGDRKQRWQVDLSLTQLHSEVTSETHSELGCLQETVGMGHWVPWGKKFKQVQGGWRSWGVYTQTRTFSDSSLESLSLTHCAGRSLFFCQDLDTNIINTQFSGQLLHPTDAGRVSTEKGRAVNRAKAGQKIFSAFNRSLRLLTAAFVRWMEGQC